MLQVEPLQQAHSSYEWGWPERTSSREALLCEVWLGLRQPLLSSKQQRQGEQNCWSCARVSVPASAAVAADAAVTAPASWCCLLLQQRLVELKLLQKRPWKIQAAAVLVLLAPQLTTSVCACSRSVEQQTCSCRWCRRDDRRPQAEETIPKGVAGCSGCESTFWNVSTDHTCHLTVHQLTAGALTAAQKQLRLVRMRLPWKQQVLCFELPAAGAVAVAVAAAVAPMGCEVEHQS